MPGNVEIDQFFNSTIFFMSKIYNSSYLPFDNDNKILNTFCFIYKLISVYKVTKIASL